VNNSYRATRFPDRGIGPSQGLLPKKDKRNTCIHFRSSHQCDQRASCAK